MTAGLSERLDRYLQLRRALGYSYYDRGRLLADFVEVLHASGLAVVTVDAALAWANRAPTDPAVAARLSMVRGFARYLAAFDDNNQVPPTWLVPQNKVRPTPHIYAAWEIEALMQAARLLTPPLWAATMGTLIGLAASTGLRPSELYRLGRDDIDFAAGQLRVLHSKHGKSRQIPLHATTIEALHRYSVLRDSSIEDPTASFFVGPDAVGLSSRLVSSSFKRLATTAGVPAAVRARLGDLRHSFAVSTLLAWYQDGVDVQRQLPVLSAFLGHNVPAEDVPLAVELG
jgi:integrase/recombinase XerD